MLQKFREELQTKVSTGELTPSQATGKINKVLKNRRRNQIARKSRRINRK